MFIVQYSKIVLGTLHQGCLLNMILFSSHWE